MGVSYAQRNDVFSVGVPSGALTRPARQIEGADPATDILQIAGHGLKAGAPVQFKIAGSGVLPLGLALLTVYYALLVTLADGSTDENRFQVSTTPNGAAVNFTDAGAAPFSLVVPTGPLIDDFLETYSRWADSVMPADAVPLSLPYPKWVSHIVALRSAIAVANALGNGTPLLATREDTEIKDFMRLAAGIPLRGDVTAQVSTNTAVVQTAASGGQVQRGTLP